jgi:hypothetical protein
MLPERLLEDAADAAPLTPAGTATLRKQLETAEASLTAVQRAYAKAQAAEERLTIQDTRITALLDELASHKRVARLQAASRSLAVLDSKKDADIPAALVEIGREIGALIEKGKALEDLRHIIATESANLSLKTVQAQLAVTHASKAWVVAASHADLHGLQVSLLSLA